MNDDTGESMGEYEEMWGLLHAMDSPVPIWVTRDKKRIPINKMEDSHLLHTINMLRGKSPIGTKFMTDPVTRRNWLNVLSNEAYSRGLEIPEVDEKDPVHE